MARPKYDEWLDKWSQKENLVLLQGWVRDGLTDEDIASNMGISIRTFYEWKKREESAQVAQTLKQGKEVVDYLVENALVKNALAGNVVAQIFWLKNRRPDRWRDKVEHEVHDDTLENAEGILVRMREAAQDDARTVSDSEAG